MDSNKFIPLLASFLFACACVAQEDVAEILWETDYAGAIEKAHKEKKPVLLDFYADWCGPCKMMDQQTFTDERVAQATKGFIAVRVNVDANEDVAYTYRIQGIPRTIILNIHDQMVGDRIGFLDADEYLTFLSDVKEFTHQKMEGDAIEAPKSRAEMIQISADTTSDALLEYLGDPDPTVRKKAREEFRAAHRSAEEKKATLERALTHPYLGVRIAAWEILAETLNGVDPEFDPWTVQTASIAGEVPPSEP